MIHIGKKLSVMLIIAVLILNTFSSVRASSYTIYETSSKETITSGATLEKITRFTSDGWLNINVLSIDLSNPNIKVDTMSNSNSIKTLTTVKSLAQSRGAVAGINGGFFNWMTQAADGYPDGPIVESGKITTASSEYNRYSDSMATFSLNNLNQILYDYWKTDITLIAPNGSSTPVGQYNKPSKDYTDFTILDGKWSSTSIGATPDYPDMVEMVVDGGKVVEIRQAKPAVEIPVNGYVVITRQAGSQFLLNNFKPGDVVGMNIATNPNWKNLKMAVTGGAILVKDGKIPSPFSIDISGNNPRTAIGSTQDGTHLILATVDGRQASSTGMTQQAMAQLMIEQGAYNALNLDGGGSTTMLARTPGTNDLEVTNSPSDGTPRKIATAIGIFSIAPPSALDGLVMDTDDSNVFVNTSRQFNVKGYDRYFNPVQIDPSQVKWSVSGIQGSFKGNTFYPTSVGDGKITASIGSASTELDISSLSSPAQLVLNNKSLKLAPKESTTFTVSGKNINGYSASINPADVNWSVSGNVGSFSKDTFTATNGGTGYIDASVGSTHSYCSVSVASEAITSLDGFEANNGSFAAAPAGLPGSYEISNQQNHSGKTSGKLTYDFTTNLSTTRAAYMVFPGNGLKLASNTLKLGLWVYNSHASPDWLRAEIRDSKGNIQRVDFVKSMDWTGWKYVEAPLQDIDSPAQLTKLYIAQVSPVADSGSIFIDDLSAITSSYPSIDASKVPQDTAPVDAANKSISYQASSDSFRFAVLGESSEPQNLLEKLLLSNFSGKVNSYLDAAAFVGSSAHKDAALVTKPTVSTNTGSKAFDIKDGRFIQLDMSKQGIRASNSNQWQWFLQQLDSAKGSKIFVFLAGSPQSFSDKQEAGVFQDILTKYRKQGKTIWVFYQGNKNSSYMEDGIKYITTASYDAQGLTPNNTDGAKYLLVTVKGSNVTYEFKLIV